MTYEKLMRCYSILFSSFIFFPFLCEMREFSSYEKGIKSDIKKSQETQRSRDSNQVLVVFTGWIVDVDINVDNVLRNHHGHCAQSQQTHLKIRNIFRFFTVMYPKKNCNPVLKSLIVREISNNKILNSWESRVMKLLM